MLNNLRKFTVFLMVALVMCTGSCAEMLQEITICVHPNKILLKILMTIVMATRTVHIPLQIKQCRALTLDKVREMRMVSSSAVD